MPPSSEPGRGELSAINVLRAFCVLGKCITRSGRSVSKKLNTGEEAAGSTAEFLNCAHLATIAALIDAPRALNPNQPHARHKTHAIPSGGSDPNRADAAALSPFDWDRERNAGPPSDNPPDRGSRVSTIECVARGRGSLEILTLRRGHGRELRA